MFRALKMVALTALASTLVASALAGKFNNTVSVGDAAPAFKDIVGVDDKPHGLDDYQDAKAVVVVFTCNHCPVAVAYEDRLVALQKDFQDQGVQFVAISVNNEEADRLEAMKVRAAEKGFNFPYLHDETQKSARAYGAAVTPHVFLLDGDRKIAYMGAIDDNMNEPKVKKHHLRDAISAVLEGKTPETPETRQFGCGVKYED